MVTKSRFLVFILFLFLGACSYSPLGSIQIETPEGEKIGCVPNFQACTETCDIQKDGYKVKSTTPLKPELCEAPAPESKVFNSISQPQVLFSKVTAASTYPFPESEVSLIYDSLEQKNFIIEAIKKYPTTIESALQLSQAFGQAIQDGRIIPAADQVKALPVEKSKAEAGAPPSVPKNRKARRASKVIKKNA